MPECIRVSCETLADGDSLSFELPEAAGGGEGFVTRRGSDYFVYRNRCPHWGVDLDMGFGEFYDPKLDRIFCRNHGALFQLDDGLCVWGPCTGKALESLPYEREGEALVIALPTA